MFFLPLVFLIYWRLNHHLRWQNIFLLAVSYFFYGLWDYRFLSLILLSSFIDYFVAMKMDKTQDSATKRMLLGISLVSNLGLLVGFKYFNFFIESFITLCNWIGVQPNVHTLHIILPVGISFYTFQTLSYTIDVYRGQLKSTSNMINFLTYVAFFPQLVAGPIERAAHLLPQIENKRVFNYEKAILGMRQILWGLFTKVVIADNCAKIADSVFRHYQELGSAMLICGVLLFAFQIYCDFAGYSHIAIGSARLLGMDLMQNFATPYFSRSIAEFWQRWHISLSTWFRDYLYIPLGGSRVSKILQVRNIFTIFLVSGFWHGANWTFILWGFIHAVFYLPRIFFPQKTYPSAVTVASLHDLWKIFTTFLFVNIAWIFFRIPTIQDGFYYLTRIFSAHHSFSADLTKIKIPSSKLGTVAIYIAVLLLIEWITRQQPFALAKMPQQRYVRYCIYVVFCLFILEYFYGETAFIYFQF